MEKEMSNVLEFFKNTYNLKSTVVDFETNYSAADNLFGAMILAIACNSEFKEGTNLGKIIKMMVLTEYCRLNPDYDFSKLKMGDEFVNLISETMIGLSEDAMLVQKYMTLNIELSRLVNSVNEDTDIFYLRYDAREILMPIFDNKEKCDEIFRFYFENSKLNHKIRAGWDNEHWDVQAPRVENVAEHIVSTVLEELVTYSEFEYNDNVNIDNVVVNTVLHEEGEILIGDIPVTDQRNDKLERERTARNIIFGALKMKNEYLKELMDFDDKLGNDAKFTFMCDKMEADLTCKIYYELGYHKPFSEQVNNKAFNSSTIKNIVANGITDVFDIWYEYDKSLYIQFGNFIQFRTLLDYARENDLYKKNAIEKILV